MELKLTASEVQKEHHESMQLQVMCTHDRVMLASVATVFSLHAKLWPCSKEPLTCLNSRLNRAYL